MSKRKLGLAILTALLCVCMAMFLVACGTQGEQGEKGEQGEAGADGISIVSVEKVDSEGLTDTYKITYLDGNSTTFTVTNGKDGADGQTPFIGENGNWWIGSVDTGIPAKGQDGSDGEDGTDGEDGQTPFIGENGNWWIGSVDTGVSAKGENGTDGKDGISITDVDINDAGELILYFSEGEPVNLGKIVGENGQDGEDGVNGVGIEGATIDENGNLTLTLTDDSIVEVGNIKGKDGTSITGVVINENSELVVSFSDGTSSNLGKILGIADISLEDYNLTITLSDGTKYSLGNIRGEKGEAGESAYELYKEKFGYEGTEEQWLIDLANGNLAVVETHTVTFDAQGGSPEPEAQEVKHLGKASKPENPVKDGFLFDGWYYQGEKWSFVGYVVTEDMTLTAQWSEAESGCEITSAEGFEFGTEIIDENEVQTITRKVANATQSFNLAANISVSDGCTWRLFADYAQSEEITSKMMTDLQTGDNIAWLVVYGESDQTLYKVNVYRRHIRNYTFQSEGETHTSGTIEEDHKLNIPETNPTNKAGYTFSHWTVDGEQVIFPYTVAVDTTFIAVFAPNNNTLHFDGNGATGGGMDDMTIATDASANLTANGYVRAGYTFKGWATNASGEVVYADGAQYTMGTESEYTLYAVWEANNNTLHFDGNGATGGSMDDMTIATDASANLTANGYVRTGYIFKGWATSAGGTVKYEDGSLYTMGTESQYTLYAVWEANTNTLHFDKNDENATGQMNSVQMKTDEVQNLPAVGYEKVGYHLKGWATSAEGEPEYTDQATYTMGTESEYTLYAVWEANINILRFDGNGATSGTMDDMTIATDASANLTTNAFERTGYTFEGWSTSAGGAVEYTDGALYTMGTESENTLYAVWEIITYTITYELDSGQNDEENPATFTVEDLPLTIHAAIKTEYLFMGWYITEDFSGEPVTVLSEVGNITLYAKFLESSNLTYRKQDGGYEVTGYKGTLSEIFIPDYHLNEPVIAIGYGAFRDYKELETAIFGGNSQITSIGDSAFYGCSNLTSIEIPSGVTSIDSGAFKGCSGLTSIEIPSGVTFIGDYAFSGCSSLTGVYISDIEAWCAIDFDSPSSNPLNDAHNLYLNGALVTELTIPYSVTTIGAYTFFDCSSLTSVTFGENSQLTSIGDSAFSVCSSLTSIEIPSGVTTIGGSAFLLCRGLTSVTFGENSQLTSIGDSAFLGCSNLTSIEIPSGVTSIGDSAFSGCSNIDTINVASNNSVYKSDGNCLTEISTNTLIVGCKNSIIPNYVTSIGNSAFSSCSSLTSIEIPSGVTSIGDSAFASCRSLTRVTFGANSQLTSIGSFAFRDCSNLTSIKIPSGVTSIGNSVFYGCSSLMSVIFGKNSQLTSISSGAFEGCSSLESIEIPSAVTSIGDWLTFSGCESLTTVFYGGASILEWREIEGVNHVPSSAKIYYYSEGKPTTAGNYWHYVNGVPSKWEWGNSKTFHFETNGGNSIDDIVAAALTALPTPVKEGYWFSGWYDNPECTGTAITVPYYDAEKTTLYAKWVEATGDQSEGLEIKNGMIVGIGTCEDTVLHIYLPIADNAFSGCSQITEVYLYDGCTFIGEKAFSGCSNLKSVYFMQTTMPEISSDVFANTWNSTSFVVFVPQELYDEYAAVEDTYWQQYIVDAGKLYPME